VDEALELRRQHHVGHDDPEDQRKHQIAEGFGHRAGLAAILRQVVRRQDFARNAIELLDRLSQRNPLEIRKQRDRPLAVRPVDHARSAPFLDPDEVVQFHQPSVPGPHIDPSQVARVLPLFRREAHAEIIAFSPAVILVFGHFGFTAHQDIDRLGNRRNVHPQIRGLVPVDEDLEFGLAHLQRGVDIHDPRNLAELGGNLTRVGLYGRKVRPADAVLDRHLPLTAADHREVLRGHLQTGELTQSLANLLLQLHLVLLAFAPWDQTGHQKRAVDGAADALPVKHRPNLGHLTQDLLGGPEEFIGLVEGVVDRRLQPDDELPLILGRAELLPHELRHVEAAGEQDHGSDQHDPAMVQRKDQDAAVYAFDFSVGPFEPVPQGLRQTPAGRTDGFAGRLPGRGRPALEKDRREHRRQRERDEKRNQDRKDDGQCKLHEEPPDHPLHEGDRQKDRDDRKGGRHDRQADLRGGESGGFARRHPLLDVTVDVLDDDDRVVDQQTDGQAQGQHRHVVEGEVERPDQRKGRDDRNGQRNGADQGGPDVVEEDENRQNREEGSEPQVILHLGDGAPDEVGLVDGDVEVHSGRQGLVDLSDLRPDRVGDGNGVGAGLFLNPHRDGRNAIVAGDVPPLFHPVLHVSEVLQSHGGAVLVGNDQVVEFGNLDEFPLDLDRVLLVPAFDSPAGKLDVLLLERGHDVVGGQRVGPELRGIQPDAHLAELKAAQLDIADAVDPLKLLLEDLVDIRGKLPDRFLTREIQKHDRRRIGIHLRDPRLFNVVGQFVSDQRDLLPNILDGEIDVPLENELHRDPGIAVRAAGRDGLYPVDGVDGPLDLVGDIDIDHFGTGAFEIRGDAHDREIDLGHQIHADLRITDHAQDHEGQDDHRGEHGPFDRGISQPHGRAPLPSGCFVRP